MREFVEIFLWLNIVSVILSPLLIGKERPEYTYLVWLLNLIESAAVIYLCATLLKFVN